MENIMGVMQEKYRKTSATRSLKHFRKTLDQEDFDIKRFDSKQEYEDYLFLNIVSFAYQDGVSAGKKLSDKNDMNEIDAIEFTIKELKKRKDELKVQVTEEINSSVRYKVVLREAYSSEEDLLGSNLSEEDAIKLCDASTNKDEPFQYREMIKEK